MTLLSKGGAELRYVLACLFIPGAAFIPPQGGTPATVFVLVALLVHLLSLKISSSAASWLALDSQELVAHYTLRPSKRIPLARIAAVEIRKSIFSDVPFVDSRSVITVFRKDLPDIIEIRARSWEVETFSFALAQNASRLGVRTAAPFAVPRSQYFHDLLPILAALGVVGLFSFPRDWRSLALAVVLFVVCSAMTWLRFAKLSKRIAAGEIPTSHAPWARLLQSCSFGR